jgi:hypothetical protein
VKDHVALYSNIVVCLDHHAGGFQLAQTSLLELERDLAYIGYFVALTKCF